MNRTNYVVVYNDPETDDFVVSVTDGNWDDLYCETEQEAVDESDAISSETGYSVIWE